MINKRRKIQYEIVSSTSAKWQLLPSENKASNLILVYKTLLNIYTTSVLALLHTKSTISNSLRLEQIQAVPVRPDFAI